MAVSPILKLPDPVLRQRAKEVRKIDSSELKLAEDMVETIAGNLTCTGSEAGPSLPNIASMVALTRYSHRTPCSTSVPVKVAFLLGEVDVDQDSSSPSFG